MAFVDTGDLVSISEANTLGISALAKDAEQGRERVLLRNNTPIAAIINIEHLNRLQELEEDLLDIALATARMLTSDSWHSLDSVIEMFGFTREELEAEPDQ